MSIACAREPVPFLGVAPSLSVLAGHGMPMDLVDGSGSTLLMSAVLLAMAAMRGVNAAADGCKPRCPTMRWLLERQQVAGLPQGSLRQMIAGDGLDLREVERLLRHLQAGDDVTALEAALARFSATPT